MGGYFATCCRCGGSIGDEQEMYAHVCAGAESGDRGAVRNRLKAAWNVLRGRPTLYRVRMGEPLWLLTMSHVAVIECEIRIKQEAAK